MVVAGCIISETTKAQNNQAALAAADTTNFSKNTSGGWSLYNSYLAHLSEDSVRLELILQQSNAISWQEEQYVGKIKTESLRPATERVLSFVLSGNIYQISIKPTGKCYLKLSSGSVPTNYPVIIPLRVIYKK